MNGPINKGVSSALPRVFSRRSAILKIVEEKALGTRLEFGATVLRRICKQRFFPVKSRKIKSGEESRKINSFFSFLYLPCYYTSLPTQQDCVLPVVYKDIQTDSLALGLLC